ncbi:MAG TPA: hypothetical protein VNV86_22395 [Candidatus Acidoferrum sp.]|jgi:hypothetical protein|nr:hypothetical protein [Candidatus Acidoferrum sp.]
MGIRALVLGLMLAAAAWSQAPSGLTVRAATNKKVDLGWSGTAASYTVQRRVLGGSFGNIATVNNATTYSDTSIDVPAGLADGEYPLSVKVNGVASQSGVILPVTH